MADEAPPAPPPAPLESPKPRKRWFRFSLRTLLVVFLIASTAPYLYKRIIVYREMSRLREVLAKDARESFSGTSFLPQDYGYDLLIEQIEAEAQDPEIDLRVRIGLANILMDAGADENLTYSVEKEGLRAANSRAVELLGVRPYLIAALWPEVEAAYVHGDGKVRARIIELIFKGNSRELWEIAYRMSRLCEVCAFDSAERKRSFESQKKIAFNLLSYSSRFGGCATPMASPLDEQVAVLKKAHNRWEKAAIILMLNPYRQPYEAEDLQIIAPQLETIAFSYEEDELVRRAAVDALKACGEPGAAVVKKLAESGDAKAKDIAETGMAGAKW